MDLIVNYQPSNKLKGKFNVNHKTKSANKYRSSLSSLNYLNQQKKLSSPLRTLFQPQINPKTTKTPKPSSSISHSNQTCLKPSHQTLQSKLQTNKNTNYPSTKPKPLLELQNKTKFIPKLSIYQNYNISLLLLNSSTKNKPKQTIHQKQSKTQPK